MRKSKELLGLPVLDLQAGKVLGKLRGFLIDPIKKAVVAYTVSESRWARDDRVIGISDVYSVGRDAVTVREARKLVKALQTFEFRRLAENRVELYNTRVLTESGQYLGAVDEFTFDPADGRILGYYLTTGRLKDAFRGRPIISASEVLTIGKDAVIVKEQVSAQISASPSSNRKIPAESREESSQNGHKAPETRENPETPGDSQTFAPPPPAGASAPDLPGASAPDLPGASAPDPPGVSPPGNASPSKSPPATRENSSPANEPLSGNPPAAADDGGTFFRAVRYEPGVITIRGPAAPQRFASSIIQKIDVVSLQPIDAQDRRKPFRWGKTPLGETPLGEKTPFTARTGAPDQARSAWQRILQGERSVLGSRDRLALLGKKVRADVLTADGESLLAAGEAIDEAVVERAEETGSLYQLVLGAALYELTDKERDESGAD